MRCGYSFDCFLVYILNVNKFYKPVIKIFAFNYCVLRDLCLQLKYELLGVNPAC